MPTSPTIKQIEFAARLGIIYSNQSKRVLSAMIQDQLEEKSFKEIRLKMIKTGQVVRYIGNRTDMPKSLIVSTIAESGYIYFKKTHKYCRPWDIVIEE